MLIKILSGILMAIILLGAGIFIGGTKLPRKAIISNGDQDCLSQSDLTVARENSPLPPEMIDPAKMEIKNVNGTIQKIEGDKLTVKVNIPGSLANQDFDIRTIIIDANTKISLYIQKDQAQFEKEMQAFKEKMRQPQPQTDPSKAPEPIAPPAPFEIKELKASDLKENQQVSITASENVRDKKEFTAVQIDMYESDATPDISAPAVIISPK